MFSSEFDFCQCLLFSFCQAFLHKREGSRILYVDNKPRPELKASEAEPTILIVALTAPLLTRNPSDPTIWSAYHAFPAKLRYPAVGGNDSLFFTEFYIGPIFFPPLVFIDYSSHVRPDQRTSGYQIVLPHISELSNIDKRNIDALQYWLSLNVSSDLSREGKFSHGPYLFCRSSSPVAHIPIAKIEWLPLVLFVTALVEFILFAVVAKSMAKSLFLFLLCH